MSTKHTKTLQRNRSTQQLIGIDQLTEHGLKTEHGELVFYLIRPDNLSVLSSEGIHSRIISLTNLLRSTDNICMLALDSRESFQRNKLHYQYLMDTEEEPALRKLLQQDSTHLDAIQSSTASSREFALVYRINTDTPADTGQLKRLESRIHNCGFLVRLANEQDIKRLLAVYYQQDVTTEYFYNFDGEGSVALNEEKM